MIKTITTFQELGAVKAGNVFMFQGYRCIAYRDAVTLPSGYAGELNTYIDAGRAHGAMASGYELAGINESESRFSPLTINERMEAQRQAQQAA